MTAFEDLTQGPDGLVPVIVQDATSGVVLMVAYMNEEAWDRTHDTGFVHFYSRSRQSLWKKGETSGNTLELRSLVVDCDSDAILATVQPNGPTCHTGTVSCFGDTDPSFGRTVDAVAGTIARRVANRQEGSYTVTLVDDPNLAARKVLEEAGEVAFAFKDLETGADPARVVEEAADVMYHLLALLAAANIEPSEVAAELQRRHRPETA